MCLVLHQAYSYHDDYDCKENFRFYFNVYPTRQRSKYYSCSDIRRPVCDGHHSRGYAAFNAWKSSENKSTINVKIYLQDKYSKPLTTRRSIVATNYENDKTNKFGKSQTIIFCVIGVVVLGILIFFIHVCLGKLQLFAIGSRNREYLQNDPVNAREPESQDEPRMFIEYVSDTSDVPPQHASGGHSDNSGFDRPFNGIQHSRRQENISRIEPRGNASEPESQDEPRMFIEYVSDTSDVPPQQASGTNLYQRSFGGSFPGTRHSKRSVHKSRVDSSVNASEEEPCTYIEYVSDTSDVPQQASGHSYNSVVDRPLHETRHSRRQRSKLEPLANASEPESQVESRVFIEYVSDTSDDYRTQSSRAEQDQRGVGRPMHGSRHSRRPLQKCREEPPVNAREPQGSNEPSMFIEYVSDIIDSSPHTSRARSDYSCVGIPLHGVWHSRPPVRASREELPGNTGEPDQPSMFIEYVSDTSDGFPTLASGGHSDHSGVGRTLHGTKHSRPEEYISRMEPTEPCSDAPGETMPDPPPSYTSLFGVPSDEGT